MHTLPSSRDVIVITPGMNLIPHFLKTLKFMVFSVVKDDEVKLVFHYSCTIINVNQKELQHTVTQELQY